MTMAHPSAVVALALGLAASCGQRATNMPETAIPRWADASTVGGACPIGGVMVRLFYSDCRKEADQGPVSVLGVR